MARLTDAPDIIGAANHGPLFAQREASPEVSRAERVRLIIQGDPTSTDSPVGTLHCVDPTLPRGRAAMRGGRETALDRLAPHLTGLRGKVYAGIVAYGPVTRETLAGTLAMKENTVNGRASELLKAGFVRVTGYDRTTGRGLLAITSPEE